MKSREARSSSLRGDIFFCFFYGERDGEKKAGRGAAVVVVEGGGKVDDNDDVDRRFFANCRSRFDFLSL